VRDDIASLVGAWDKKTAKKAKRFIDTVDRVGDVAGSETVIAVEPCASRDPDTGGYGSWGSLGLTEHRLIFEGRRGSARLSLRDIDELNIYDGVGEGSFLVSMMTGGVIEVRVGSESSLFEIQTNAATGRIWPALQECWSAAKDRPRAHADRGGGNAGASVADELKKLAELRAQGILTNEEFEQQKQRLLG
jgi:hypothetical protein